MLSTTAGNTRPSLTAMMLPTNDGFVGMDGWEIPGAPRTYTINLNAYDAGTEVNEETAATVPGPAGGGEGFNAARSDALNAIRVHAGVISADDGLATSVLKSNHRFDNPVMSVLIERIR